MRRIYLLLFLIVVRQTVYIAPCFEKAREHKCNTKEVIECNGPLGNCKCDNGTKCLWTSMASIKGCPCET